MTNRKPGDPGEKETEMRSIVQDYNLYDTCRVYAMTIVRVQGKGAGWYCATHSDVSVDECDADANNNVVGPSPTCADLLFGGYLAEAEAIAAFTAAFRKAVRKPAGDEHHIARYCRIRDGYQAGYLAGLRVVENE